MWSSFSNGVCVCACVYVCISSNVKHRYMYVYSMCNVFVCLRRLCVNCFVIAYLLQIKDSRALYFDSSTTG